MCGEFRNHPTNHLIKNLFKHHDNSNFEVYIFSYNHDDAAREYIENNVYKFVSLNDLDNEKASKLIVDYNLDILIDLAIIITDNRQDIINNNSAKKIISYLGFPGTSGSKIYDYIITDQTVTPLSQQKYYTEKFLYMPRTYQVNDGERIYLNKKLTTKKEELEEGTGKSEPWEDGFKRRVVKTTKPEHLDKGYKWRIKGKDRDEISIKLYKSKPDFAEFKKQMKRVAGHEFGG